MLFAWLFLCPASVFLLRTSLIGRSLRSSFATVVVAGCYYLLMLVCCLLFVCCCLLLLLVVCVVAVCCGCCCCWFVPVLVDAVLFRLSGLSSTAFMCAISRRVNCCNVLRHHRLLQHWRSRKPTPRSCVKPCLWHALAYSTCFGTTTTRTHLCGKGVSRRSDRCLPCWRQTALFTAVFEMGCRSRSFCTDGAKAMTA